MKKILWLVWCGVLLTGCASAPIQKACTDAFARPSYFDQGEELAGFAFSAGAYNYGLNGILQIKRSDIDTYQAVAFAVDGYQLFQAVITAQGVEYPFLSPVADRSAVRKRLTRFLTLLLEPPAQLTKCQVKEGGVRRVTYKTPGKVIYEYPARQLFPTVAIRKKTFSSARVEYGEYQPYGEGLLPYGLHYEDGPAWITLRLLTLKK